VLAQQTIPASKDARHAPPMAPDADMRLALDDVMLADLERFPAKRKPVRVKKTRQNKRLEPRSDSIGTKKGLECQPDNAAIAVIVEQSCHPCRVEPGRHRGYGAPSTRPWFFLGV